MRVSPSRTRRLATTMSAPSRQRSTMSGISSGGSCRSPSSIATASPRAWSRPAVIAIWCPNGRERCSTRSRSSASASSSRISAVPSVEPSSTTISSYGRPSRVATMRRWNSRTRSTSSSIGETTLRSRSSRIGASVAAPRAAGALRRQGDCSGLCRGIPDANMCSMYAELHAHSAFSFLDGASLPDELAGAAAELGYGAMALTDHNSVSGSMEFAQAAGALGLRAIHGAEIDLDDDRHITLLVEDATGWRNLCRILTRAHAHTRDKHEPPQVPLETVEEHAQGLVCLSG